MYIRIYMCQREKASAVSHFLLYNNLIRVRACKMYYTRLRHFVEVWNTTAATADGSEYSTSLLYTSLCSSRVISSFFVLFYIRYYIST